MQVWQLAVSILVSQKLTVSTAQCAHIIVNIVYNQGGINEMERPRGVTLIYSCGGDPLCTLHRAEGLYG